MPRPRSTDRDAEIHKLIDPAKIKDWVNLWDWCRIGEESEGQPESWHDHPDLQVRAFAKLKTCFFASNGAEQRDLLMQHMSDRTRQRLLARLRQRVRTRQKERLQLQRVDLPKKLVDDYDHLADRSDTDRVGIMEVALKSLLQREHRWELLVEAAKIGRGRGAGRQDMSGEDVMQKALSHYRLLLEMDDDPSEANRDRRDASR